MAHLSVDIGNTNIVFGLYKKAWIKTLRLETQDTEEASILEFLKRELKSADFKISEITVSSVVPEITNKVMTALSKTFSIDVMLIKPEVYPLLDLQISNPEEIGTDLVSNAVAAHDHFNDDCIIVDFGTALTFTIVKDQSIYGVNILPGIKTALKALIGNASQLQDIPLELPSSVIGKDTVSAIQSGMLWGYVGLVEKKLERIELELQTPLKRVATGGLALVLTPLEKEFDLVDQHLTLEGLRLIKESSKMHSK